MSTQQNGRSDRRRHIGSQARELDRRLTTRQWCGRFALIVLSAMTLVWSFRASGIEPTKLFANAERAVDYLLGAPVSEENYEERIQQVETEIRMDFQAEARDELIQRYAEANEPLPGPMQLAREAERRAEQRIESMPDGKLEALVESKLGDIRPGTRRGGYLPPETDPKKIFGDPDRLPPESMGARLAEWVGGQPGRAIRWIATAMNGGRGGGYTGELAETVAIAIWGTLLALVAALPASLFAAERSFAILYPGHRWWHRLGRWVGRFVIRRGFDVSRGFNEVVMAMIFVAVLGLGPFPGVLALSIHTFGILGKVFSEAIESVDTGPVEGVTSTGAAPGQIVSFSVLPQILPAVVSYTLLRFESNVRGATILGVVGAGGIGQLLMDKFGAFEFQEVATMMILIIAAVTAIDFGCGRVMRRFI